MPDRSELRLIKEKGYQFEDPFEVVSLFENKIASFIGAPYGIAVDCCTHALELSLRYLKAQGAISIPKKTYLSVPMTVLKLGATIEWKDISWEGSYPLAPYPVIDASVNFRPATYHQGTFHCLSFQQKKPLSIGRGGMILTDDAAAADWLRRASYDGRTRGTAWKNDKIKSIGYHYYLTPEDAARGILLFDALTAHQSRVGTYLDYPDISTFEVFR